LLYRSRYDEPSDATIEDAPGHAHQVHKQGLYDRFGCTRETGSDLHQYQSLNTNEVTSNIVGSPGGIHPTAASTHLGQNKFTTWLNDMPHGSESHHDDIFGHGQQPVSAQDDDSMSLPSIDESRIEMLTQIGRQALQPAVQEVHDTIENPMSATSAEADSQSVQVQPHFTSRMAVDPKILSNLGSKRSRPNQPPRVEPTVSLIDSTVIEAEATREQTTVEPTRTLLTDLSRGIAFDLPPSSPITMDLARTSPCPGPSAGADEARPLGLLEMFAVSERSRTPNKGYRADKHGTGISTSGNRHSRLADGFDRSRKDASRPKLPSLTTSNNIDDITTAARNQIQPKANSAADKDMYITIGLMLKAQEREKMLKEKVSGPIDHLCLLLFSALTDTIESPKAQLCEELKEKLRVLQNEVDGARRTLEIQGNILQQKDTKDKERLKRYQMRQNELTLQISQYKSQIQASTKIQANYQADYLEILRKARKELEKEYEGHFDRHCLGEVPIEIIVLLRRIDMFIVDVCSRE
jgi:hypothetical protein